MAGMWRDIVLIVNLDSAKEEKKEVPGCIASVL